MKLLKSLTFSYKMYKNGQTYVLATRFLKYLSAFVKIMHERVKNEIEQAH